MMIDVVLTERIDGISYSYKTSPNAYSSYFNKIKKVRDSYKMYCIPISEYSDEWDDNAMCQYLRYKIDTAVYDRMLNSSRLNRDELKGNVSKVIVDCLRQYHGGELSENI